LKWFLFPVGQGERNVTGKSEGIPVTDKRALRSNPLVWAMLGAALLLRLVLAPSAGYEKDIYSFATWMRAAVSSGVSHIYQTVPWCDYPPGYLYLLKSVGFLWQTVTTLPIPADNTVAIRFLVKTVPILADLAGAWVLYLIAMPRSGRKVATAALAFYAFNPAAVFNGAVWGQVDSLTALLVLLSVWSLIARRCGVAFALAAAATLVKFQAVVLIPVLIVGAYCLEGGRGIRAAYKGLGFVSLILLLPFFWTGNVESVISVATRAVGHYPNISMHAHNLWWIIGGKMSPVISDEKRIGNALMSYHDLGLLIFGAVTLLILWKLWRSLRSKAAGDPAPALFLAATLEMTAFYLFPTQMHERYIVPAIITLAAFCIWRPKIWWLYGVFSLGVFISLASTLQAVYPGNSGALGWYLPAGREETYVISGVFLIIFFILFSLIKDRRFVFLASVSTALLAIVVTVMFSFPLEKPQLLSAWKPVKQSQDWGTLHFNRTVDDRRLSVAGFIFRHGLGTHANSRVTYHLNGAFRKFDTAFGIDDEANRGQKVQFRILADGVVRYDSGIIPSGGWPKHTTINVTGSEYLTLEVLDGGDGINYDHADWLEPVLYR
jgi:Gpi18-like mannosyltransferase